MRAWLFVPLVGVALALGCAGNQAPSEAPAPRYDAAAIAQAALQELDKNNNRTIDANELNACPALRRALAAIDRNNDGKLTASEIETRVQTYAARGSVSVTCTVMLDEEPLSGASVSFEPEKFMGEALKTATTTTDTRGATTTFQIEGKSYATLPLGLYRIRVTKEGTKLPARYNAQTILGGEVFPDARLDEAIIELLLTSR